jgi:alpha-L-fucosidase
MQKILFVALLSLLLAAGAAAQEQRYTPPTDPLVLKKLAWWSDAKFGLLMHWGTYSQWGIVESWSICPEDEEWCRRLGPDSGNYAAYKASYERLKSTFNPARFAPERWAKAAAAAGMKYVVFTTKHHDGFCMFDTKETDYKITDPGCAFAANPRSDVTKEIFNAFRAEGLGVGAYFSKADWHVPSYWNPRWPPKDRHVNYDPAKYPALWSAFRTFTANQIRELMTGYGPVDILWLDGGWVRPNRASDSACASNIRWNEDINMDGIAAMARASQPGLIVVDRDVEGPNQNYLTPEQKIPEKPLPYPWETCMTMATSWSYVPNDTYKPARELVQLLAKIVSRGGNFLLNIGPSPEGTLDDTAYGRLREIGQWMAVNGEAIYGTRPVAPYSSGDVVFTAKGASSVYAIALAGADGVMPREITFRGPAPRSGRVRLLGSGERLSCRSQGGTTTVTIPEAVRTSPPCAYAWVFTFEEGGGTR